MLDFFPAYTGPGGQAQEGDVEAECADRPARVTLDSQGLVQESQVVVKQCSATFTETEEDVRGRVWECLIATNRYSL